MRSHDRTHGFHPHWRSSHPLPLPQAAVVIAGLSALSWAGLMGFCWAIIIVWRSL